jgi:hypothetical protein
LQDTGTVKSFLLASLPPGKGTLEALEINGVKGGGCFVPGAGGGGGGPGGCVDIVPTGGGLTDGAAWVFDAPGTYLDVGDTGSTLTITDRSPAAAPELGSISLLVTAVAAVGLVAGKKRRLRNSASPRS